MKSLQRSTKTLFYSVGLLAAALLAGCGGGDQGRDPILGLPAATLVSLAVTPQAPSIALGTTQQFSASATYSDGSTQAVTAAWSSATPAVASVAAATGLATSAGVGSSVISAAFNGKTASATLTVTPAVLLSIAVTPQNPTVQIAASRQLTVLGTYSDATTKDLTGSSTFVSATPASATVSSGGLVTGAALGTSVVTATNAGKSAATTVTVPGLTLTSIAVTPQAPTVQIAATRQLAVIGTYSDSSTQDLTVGATFTSATPASATISSGGLVTGAASGSSVITASTNGKSATTTVTVPAVTLTSIAVTPLTASVLIGGQQQFVATATYSDSSTALVTNSAAWSSNSPLIATVAANGVATGVTAGSATITATIGAKSASATLTVASVIVLPPVAQPVPLGGAASFAVLAGTSLTNNAGGTTLITGDVGSPSQTTDPTLVAGFTNYKSGAILAGALADLQTAISNANGRTCDVSFAGDIDLGGQTFAPGVYCYAGAINITGTVTLSGPGVYIFRTALTLNSTANSIVALSNGATAGNVSWLPVGPTTLGANSVFKGTILGQSAAITVGDNTTLLNGRVLTAAAVTLRNNQIAK
ncbi:MULTISPECIES: Ig-like domain-containing protein [unclassified Duganella]|uniref:Ig-like domain-containing protein n=1 Tax=unclassified Duganella TaxID=2636909 RepID=UPI001E5B7965|nr:MULTISPECIES: Ig-like domain-containing protein [unclassified Duganella]